MGDHVVEPSCSGIERSVPDVNKNQFRLTMNELEQIMKKSEVIM